MELNLKKRLETTQKGEIETCAAFENHTILTNTITRQKRTHTGDTADKSNKQNAKWANQ